MAHCGAGVTGFGATTGGVYTGAGVLLFTLLLTLLFVIVIGADATGAGVGVFITIGGCGFGAGVDMGVGIYTGYVELPPLPPLTLITGFEVAIERELPPVLNDLLGALYERLPLYDGIKLEVLGYV